MRLIYSKRVLIGWPSIFLDSIRFLAALCVLIIHCRAIWFPENELDILPSNISHGAVILFFVLSGFVIAHTTSSGRRGAKKYAITRLSRLYSVFLPAIVITLICTLLIRIISPNVYAQYKQSNIIARYFISLIFCNEIWLFSSAPLLNGPIWSLSYEFWYYTIFGAFFYKRPGAKGYIIPLLTCLVAGPKILLLMMVWLIGWWAYHLPKPLISITFSWVMLLILLVLATYLTAFLPSLPNDINTTSLHWADKFFTDFIIGLLIGAAFYLLPNGQKDITFSTVVSWFRKLADLTFPIYVLHFPLLVLSKSLLSSISASQTTLLMLSFLFVFLMCGAIGTLLERNRSYWSNLFDKFFYAAEKLITTTALSKEAR